jgi:hypothetical protein
LRDREREEREREKAGLSKVLEEIYGRSAIFWFPYQMALV